MDYKNELNSDDDFDCSNSYNDNYGSNHNRDNSSGYISSGQNRTTNPNGLSKAELRKTNKPIMEKRRRARINHCLNELKTLILEAMKKDPARHTKLEKADILEMTVKHLQSLQRQQLNMAIQTDPSVVHKFKTGFVECAEEVNRYISQLDGIDTATRQRLNNHLNNCATSLEQIGSMTNFNNGYRHGHLNNGGSILPTNPLASASATATVTATSATVGLLPHLPQDLNNNSRLATAGNTFPTAAIQMNGVQLIPSRLPSGELALIVPNPHAANTAANLLTTNAVNGVNSFPSWPTTTSATATASASASVAVAAAAAAAAATMQPLPLHDNASTLPNLNSFATQLQRMSAFSKPIHQPHIAPLMKFNSHTNAATTTAATKLSASSEVINVAPKSNFHTTTAAAFHQTMPQNSTTVTSPPLSPISSVSSLSAGAGDDSSSLMQTSSDHGTSRPTTPPHDITHAIIRTANTSSMQQHSFSGVFATPPLSAESSLSLSTSSGVSSLSLTRGSKHLQQQQVSSTSGSESINGFGSSKRSLELPEDADSSNGSFDESASKRHAINISAEHETIEAAHIANETGNDCKRQKLQISPEDRDCMWRPW